MVAGTSSIEEEVMRSVHRERPDGREQKVKTAKCTEEKVPSWNYT